MLWDKDQATEHKEGGVKDGSVELEGPRSRAAQRFLCIT